MMSAEKHAALNEFLLNSDAASADQVLQSMRQNYPKEAFYALMNLLGSYGTAHHALYFYWVAVKMPRYLPRQAKI